MKLVSAGGDVYLLPAGETCIGRAEGCEIILEDPRVSRRHASVFIQGSTYLLHDHKSTNWTVLNGERVTGVARLKVGDEILIAGKPFTFLETDGEGQEVNVVQRHPAGKGSSRQTTALEGFREADNQGVRLPTARAADAYRREREDQGEQFPFVIYRFASEGMARVALLDLPSFHRAVDTNQPISEKRYIFGVFGTESGKGTLFLGGPLLNADQWNQVAKVLSKRGAILVNGRVAPAPGQPGKLPDEQTAMNPAQLRDLLMSDMARFDRSILVPESDPPVAVLIFTAENDTNARRFLSKAPLGEGVVSIVVETPESTWTHDETGIYIS